MCSALFFNLPRLCKLEVSVFPSGNCDVLVPTRYYCVWDNAPVTNISAKSGVTKSLKGIRNASINTKHNMHILKGRGRKHSQ